MSSKRLYFDLLRMGLCLCIVFRYFPMETDTDGVRFTHQCDYDTRELCPRCFPEPLDCDFFANHIVIDGTNPLNLLNRYNKHGVTYALLDGIRQVVVKNLNQMGLVEELRAALCEEHKIERSDCQLGDGEEFVLALRKRILDKEAFGGSVICPPEDERTLVRFVQQFTGPELLKLVLMKTSVQPIMLEILARMKFPVPKLIFQGGFTIVESYEGDSLAYFYDSPFRLRLEIANQIINAIYRLTEGDSHFRFYLTDIQPDNIAVKMLPGGDVKVTFVDVDNVVILNSESNKLAADKGRHVHERIDCEGCFAYVQQDLCSHKHSDLNMFAVCQLLHENVNGNREHGFLHSTGDHPEQKNLRELLTHCVYCKPAECHNRYELLTQIQEIIFELQYRYYQEELFK
ncbi:uncharacterized protein LOC129766564 [Toxorhynchites rutilus septentrionalis]|uniref:uncharacterized protein LOC129766564 n=1 Tax=Toxorhynchites rutilus septentrionalis TaxID=329112 RepID=UPI0024797C5B|nr:uncharacterized protein LOC129766564 [Toxorhynchites rutilus septentrionalis]